MSYNYNFNRKEMSAEEIASRMDFGEVLSNYKIVTKPFYKTGWFATMMTVAVAGAVALILMTSSPKEETNSNPKTATNEKTITYKEDSPCIKPPQKNADIPFISYQIDNSTGGKFTHPSGSEINIPANSFFTDGKPVDGKVEIRYREFRDQADFILSGIPMTYDSAGKQYHFESAGMLEIRAFKNNQPVDFKGEVAVNFASDYDDTKYNFYQLNETEKNWVSLGKDKVLPEENKKENENYNASDKKLIAKEITKKEEKLAEVKQEIKILQTEKPDEPAKRNKQNYSFTLDVLAEEFPELSAFSTTRFEVNPTDKNFTPKFFQSEWDDIKLDKNPKTGDLTMVLSKGGSNKKIGIFPVYEEADYQTKKDLFDKEFKQYSSKLDSRLAEEKKLEKEIAELRANSKKKSQELTEQWSENKKYSTTMMPEDGSHEEIQGKTDQAKYNNLRAVNGVLTSGEFKYDRSLKLPSMGVFNCDNAVSLPIVAKGKKHRFQFKNKDGISLGMMLIYVLEKKRNVMFTYQPADFESIRMSDDRENVIVGIMQDGNIAVAVESDLKVLNWDNKVLDVNMRVFENIKDPAELKKILNSNS
jgi:hypothetical protein